MDRETKVVMGGVLAVVLGAGIYDVTGLTFLENNQQGNAESVPDNKENRSEPRNAVVQEARSTARSYIQKHQASDFPVVKDAVKKTITEYVKENNIPKVGFLLLENKIRKSAFSSTVLLEVNLSYSEEYSFLGLPQKQFDEKMNLPKDTSLQDSVDKLQEVSIKLPISFDQIDHWQDNFIKKYCYLGGAILIYEKPACPVIVSGRMSNFMKTYRRNGKSVDVNTTAFQIKNIWFKNPPAVK